MRCEGALALDAVDRASTGLVSLAAHAHVRSCPECRRELAAQRWLRSDLHDLGVRPVPGELRGLADGLLAGIIAALDAEDQRASRRGLYALGAAALFGGVAATGAIVAATHRRRALW